MSQVLERRLEALELKVQELDVMGDEILDEAFSVGTFEGWAHELLLRVMLQYLQARVPGFDIEELKGLSIKSIQGLYKDPSVMERIEAFSDIWEIVFGQGEVSPPRSAP